MGNDVLKKKKKKKLFISRGKIKGGISSRFGFHHSSVRKIYHEPKSFKANNPESSPAGQRKLVRFGADFAAVTASLLA